LDQRPNNVSNYRIIVIGSNRQHIILKNNYVGAKERYYRQLPCLKSQFVG
jgi:hypothetical protein